MKFRLVAPTLALLIITSTVFAQASDSAIFAAFRGSKLNIYHDQIASVAIPDVFDFYTSDLEWNSDGTQLAIESYIYAGQIDVANVTEGTTTYLTNAVNIDWQFPIDWTPTGQILYAESNYSSNNKLSSLTLNQIAPAGDAIPQKIGVVPQSTPDNCRGDSSWPTESRYTIETGAFNGYYTTLEWTRYGILYSTSCSGSGYRLYDPITGESRPLFSAYTDEKSTVSHAALAPDGKTLAAIRRPPPPPAPLPYTETLVFEDLETGATPEMKSSAIPQQIGWVGTTLYYSEQEMSGNALDSFTTQEQKKIFDLLGWPSVPASRPSYTVYLHAFNPSTGADSIVATMPGFEIGRIRAVNGQVWFSVIPNEDAYLRAVLDGRVHTTWDDNFEEPLAAVPVSVYRLNGSKVELVGTDLSLFTPR